MSDFVIENGVLKKYKGNEEEVVVPKDIIEIGNYAFEGCTALASVTLPDGLEKIGNSAFRDCTTLESIAISSGLLEIGECAFTRCENLTSIALPEEIKKIGEYAFSCCKGLTSIALPKGLESICGDAFYGCYGLEEFKVDENNTQFTSIDGVLFSKDKKELIAYPAGKGTTTRGSCDNKRRCIFRLYSPYKRNPTRWT